MVIIWSPTTPMLSHIFKSNDEYEYYLVKVVQDCLEKAGFRALRGDAPLSGRDLQMRYFTMKNNFRIHIEYFRKSEMFKVDKFVALLKQNGFVDVSDDESNLKREDLNVYIFRMSTSKIRPDSRKIEFNYLSPSMNKCILLLEKYHQLVKSGKINKKKAILQCQADLINAGLEGNAGW